MNHREISIFTKDETSVNILTENELETRYKKYKAVVEEQVIQKDYKNLQGRSAILDCVARDSEETIYNIEIQQAREGTSPKRANNEKRCPGP